MNEEDKREITTKIESSVSNERNPIEVEKISRYVFSQLHLIPIRRTVSDKHFYMPEKRKL